MDKVDKDSGVSSSPSCDATHDVGNDAGNPQQQKQSAEKRGSLRRRVLKTGQIEISMNFADIPCRIRNLSETGALIEVMEKYIVPEHFTLHVAMDGFAVECQIVHRHGTKYGLRFIGEKQQLAMKKTQSIRASSDRYLEKYIRNDNSAYISVAADQLTDTQKAVRRGNQPTVGRPGFGKRGG